MTNGLAGQLLVLLAHGTADSEGQQTLQRLQIAVAEQLPGIRVELAFADVIEPTAEQVLAGSSGAVVVPLFLTSGYHVEVDATAAAASAHRVTLTPALGPDRLVVAAIVSKLRALDGPRPTRVLLTAAGSSRSQARDEVALAAQILADQLVTPVDVAFLSGPGPRLTDLVTGEDDPSTTVVASYLLAPGFFARRAREQAEQRGLRCTDPVGTAPELVALIVARYRDTIASKRRKEPPRRSAG